MIAVFMFWLGRINIEDTNFVSIFGFIVFRLWKAERTTLFSPSMVPVPYALYVPCGSAHVANHWGAEAHQWADHKNIRRCGDASRNRESQSCEIQNDVLIRSLSDCLTSEIVLLSVQTLGDDDESSREAVQGGYVLIEHLRPSTTTKSRRIQP